MLFNSPTLLDYDEQLLHGLILNQSKEKKLG